MEDRKHDILPAADQKSDRAGSPVKLPRESDCNVRRDGSSAAPVQPKQPVNERGRLHGAPELLIRVEWRIAASDRMDLSSDRKQRRWRTRHESYGRLRRQDKARFLAAGTSFLSFCLHIGLQRIGFDAARCVDGASDTTFLDFNGPSAIAHNVRRRRDRTAYADAGISTLLYDGSFLSCRTCFDFRSSPHGTR